MIDKKGKLFGIINVVDLMALVLIVLLVGALGYKMIGSKNGLSLGTETEIKDVTIRVRARLKPEETAKALSKGDKLVAKNTYANGTIESVSYEDGDYLVPTDDGRLVVTKHPLWKDIEVVIKGTTDVSGLIIKLGGQEIRIGGEYWVKTQKVEILGEVIGMEIE